jgi:hypothetical protein
MLPTQGVPVVLRKITEYENVRTAQYLIDVHDTSVVPVEYLNELHKMLFILKQISV